MAARYARILITLTTGATDAEARCATRLDDGKMRDQGLHLDLGLETNTPRMPD